MGHPTVNLSPKDSMTALIATRRQRRRCVSCVEWLYPTSADDSLLPSSVELASHTFIVSQNRPFGSGVFSRLATSPERRLDTRRVACGTKLEKHETVCGAIKTSVIGVLQLGLQSPRSPRRVAAYFKHVYFVTRVITK